MALRDWLGRLRGRGTEEVAPQDPQDPPPLTTPPGQLPVPAAPGGSPTVPPLAAPVPPAPPRPAAPTPFTPPPPLERTATGSAANPVPRPLEPPPLPRRGTSPQAEIVPRPQDDAAALREAEANSEPDDAPGNASVSAPGPAPVPAADPPAASSGWFSRLRTGLSRSTARLTGSVTTLFRKRLLNEEALEELEETLIAADLGVAASQRIVQRFRSTRFGREVTDEEVKAALAEEIAAILAPVATPMEIDPSRAPHVVLVVGVNGTGKTTTIAKLGQQYRERGLTCTFVAGDTFRAAAVEQLQIWGQRTGCAVVAPSKPGADAAGLAFDALAAAKVAGTQVLLIDTAGRLHNKTALMDELRKIIRVMRRQDPTAPHSVLLVLDATTGQNAIQQCKVFREMVAVTGLAVTKLDGSAKGGVVVALAHELALPLHMVGVGETAHDLRPFEARDFARGLVGLG